MSNDYVAEVNARLNSVEKVMEKLGVGRSTVFELMADGRLRSVKIGRRRMVSDRAIAEFINELEAADGGDAA
jgi:excisionase family DNA binding protein